MPVKHTGNTPFHSKATQIGSSRWQFSKPPVVPRGYILDMSFQPYLPHRWYAVALVYQGGAYSFRAYGAGSGADCSLDDVDVQAVIAAGPETNVALLTTDEAEALTRFERLIGHIMHNLITIGGGNEVYWQRIAQYEEGRNIWS